MTPWDWMQVALAEYGVREAKGDADNPRILEYLSTVSLPTILRHDSTPHCSAFVNWCMKQAGIRGTGSAAARSWLGWGRAIPSLVPGCVVVLWRVTRDSQFGHVAFGVAERDSNVLLLGGNQDDMVSIAPYSKTRVLGYRLPDE